MHIMCTWQCAAWLVPDPSKPGLPPPPQVMLVVKGLVRDGTTICATIHGPSSFCYGLFDRVMVLTAGRVLYFGGARECHAWRECLVSWAVSMLAYDGTWRAQHTQHLSVPL
jgi:hypothetical protein